MKHLNFLTKSGSQHGSHSSVTEALTVGSPSAHRRGAMLRLISVLVLILTIGVGNVWGDDEVIYTLNTSTTGGSNGYATLSEDIDITNHQKTITWNAVGNTTLSPWRIGGQSLNGVVSPVYSETAISENVTKVIVSYGGTFSLSSASAVLKVYSTAADAASGSNNNLISTVNGDDGTNSHSNAIGANKTHTFTRPNGHDWTGRYFRFEFACTYTSNSNKFFQLSSADFYAEPAVAHTVTLMDDISHPLQEQSVGAGVTLPSRAGCPLQDYTFVGWTASWTEEQDDWTTIAPTIIPAGAYSPSADISLYPVYTKSEEGGGTVFSNYTLVNGGSAISSGQYLISTGAFTLTTGRKNGTSTTQAGGTSVIPGSTEYSTYEVTITGNKDEFTILCSDGYYIGDGQSSTNLAFSTSTPSTNVYKWTYTATGIQNKNTTTRYIRANGTTDFRFYTTSNGTEAFLYKRNETSGSTTYYISVPNCCTELGQINGSVLVTHFLSHFYLFSFVNFILTMSKVVSAIF